jgi:signal peptidase I
LDTSIKHLKRLASYALTFLLIGVAVFAVVEYATGTQPFYVVGDYPSSMSPALNYGDVAVIYRTPFASVGVGSIIAFHDPRGNPGIIVHRVVAVALCEGTRCFVTKGDNNATNPTIDPWNVTEGDYVGRAVLVVPYVGYVSPALWGFNGLTALLPVSLIGVILILVYALRSNPRDLSKGCI